MLTGRELKRAFLRIVWNAGAEDPEWLERMDEVGGEIEQAEKEDT